MTTAEYVTLISDMQNEISRLRRKARAHKRGLRDQARAIEVWKKRYLEEQERARLLTVAIKLGRND